MKMKSPMTDDGYIEYLKRQSSERLQVVMSDLQDTIKLIKSELKRRSKK